MKIRNVTRVLVPAAVLATLGGFVIVEQHHAANVAAAEAKIQQDMAPINDPALLDLARKTAFVDQARLGAPTITGAMEDGEVVALAEGICRQLRRGVASKDLTFRDRFADVPWLEDSIVVNAAQAAYCPEVSLSGATPVEVVG